MTQKWTFDDIPDLKGRTAIVTGANSGIGYETARGLAANGATVVLACRSKERGQAAVQGIRELHPEANARFMPLDLSDLSSVRSFGQAFRSKHRSLHILINNAGVMAVPEQRTADGFEMQFGINHLGHFALTGLLIDMILVAERGRVVTVSSMMHKQGRMDFDDLNAEKLYKRWKAYGQSKLANLLFTYEL